MAALAAILFVRLLVPAGWMPAEGAMYFSVTPCPSWAPTAATPTHDHGVHKPGKNAHERGTDCAFTPLSGAATVAADVPVAALAAPDKVIRSASPRAAVGARGPPALPPPSTGPPILA